MIRFLASIFAVLIAVFISLGIVFFWGLGRIHPKYENKFFDLKTPWTVVPYSFSNYIETHADAIIWVDVSRGDHETLFVDKAELSQILKKYSGRRFVINLISNVEDIDRQVTKLLSEYPESMFLLQSEFDVVLRASKETDANFPYGSSQSDRLRFLAFEGMAPWESGLLPATPFRGDVFISALTWKKVSLVTPQILKEIRRRQKWSIIGPLNTSVELSKAQALAELVDGFFISNEALLH